MLGRFIVTLLAVGALAVPAATHAVPPGPPIPASITLPSSSTAVPRSRCLLREQAGSGHCHRSVSARREQN